MTTTLTPLRCTGAIPFLESIASAPLDVTRYRIYADWLEEGRLPGDTTLAEIIRMSCDVTTRKGLLSRYEYQLLDDLRDRYMVEVACPRPLTFGWMRLGLVRTIYSARWGQPYFTLVTERLAQRHPLIRCVSDGVWLASRSIISAEGQRTYGNAISQWQTSSTH